MSLFSTQYSFSLNNFTLHLQIPIYQDLHNRRVKKLTHILIRLSNSVTTNSLLSWNSVHQHNSLLPMYISSQFNKFTSWNNLNYNNYPLPQDALWEILPLYHILPSDLYSEAFTSKSWVCFFPLSKLQGELIFISLI